MEEKRYINEARSKKNGIVFYSNKFPLIGSKTFRDDSGKIQSIIIPTQLDGFIDYLGTLNGKGKVFNKWKVIIFDVILVSICLLFKKIWFVTAAVYFSIFASFDFFRLAKISYKMKSKKGSERSTAKYHAAEHMAINAYEKLQRIPTLDEVKTFSRFSENCGSQKIFGKIIYNTLISFALAFVASWNVCVYLVLVIAIAVLAEFVKHKGYLRFLQVLITNVPSDSELEVAIEGIKNFEEMEKNFNIGDGYYMILNYSRDHQIPLPFSL